MSGAFPDVGVSSVRLESEDPTFVSWAHSGRRFARDGGVQRWRLRATFDALTEAEGRTIMAFAARQRGQWDTFSFVSPAHAQPRGVATGAPVVDGAGQLGVELDTKGWSPSVAGILLAGDILRIAGHAKVYMLAEDADSDLDGRSTLTLTSPLIVSPTNEESVQVANVAFNVAFAADVQVVDIDPPMIYACDVEMVEVF